MISPTEPTAAALAERAVRLLNAVDLSETAGWDRRKVLLDVYYEGHNAAYVADDDEFHKRYAGLIAVARWMGRETIEEAQADLGDPMNWVVPLAAPRPAAPEGVTLTPEEAALARAWYTRLPVGVTPDDVALARRLEATS